MSLSPAPTRSPWETWRGTLAAGLGAALIWALAFRFPSVWVIAGIGESERPFVDLHGILAARDAVRAGLDPYVNNAFDVYHRPFLYTRWWLAFPALGLGRPDTLWLGTAWTALLLVVSAVWLRPQSAREIVATWLVLISPAFLLAANRANNDIVVLAAVSLGLVCLRRSPFPIQLLGVAAFALAAVLKYYPLVTVVLLLELRPWRRFLAGAAVYVGVLAIAWPGMAPGLNSASRNTPAPEWLYAFGAPSLWRDLGSNSRWGWVVLGAVVMAGAAFLAWHASRRRGPSAALPAVEREFLAAALMLVGIFFLGASYAYKLIFAIWLVPGLRSPAAGEERRWLRATWYLLLAALWLEGGVAIALNLFLGHDAARAEAVLKPVLVIQQAVEWGLIGCLARSVFIYLLHRAHEVFGGNAVRDARETGC